MNENFDFNVGYDDVYTNDYLVDSSDVGSEFDYYSDDSLVNGFDDSISFETSEEVISPDLSLVCEKIDRCTETVTLFFIAFMCSWSIRFISKMFS